MTSGTDILSVSKKLKLPVVLGASAALSKFSSGVLLPGGKELKCGLPAPLWASESLW